MHRQFHHPGATPSNLHDRGPHPPAVRTYRRIAEILAQRGGAPITPERVRQACRAAEEKVACALLGDPVVHTWFRPGARRPTTGTR